MKRKITLSLITLMIVCILSGCSSKLKGTYRAVNPPKKSGETVIETVVFNGKNITLKSGSTSTTVEYKINKDTLTLITQFGSYDYKFSRQDKDGNIWIDGLEYVKGN